MDLLKIAQMLDPRFANDMPQEVADAFANGDVTRIFRTSSDLPRASLFENEIPITGKVREFGDYTGSIYVETKDGRTARFKNPELSMGDDAGWNANKGGSVFFDNAGVFNEGQDVTDALQQAAKASSSGNISLVESNRVKASLSSSLGGSTSEEILGKNIVEYTTDFQRSHAGHAISDVFEATGQRYYYSQPNPSAGVRGQKSVESISDFTKRLPVSKDIKADDASVRVARNEVLAEEPPSKPKSSTLKVGKQVDDLATITTADTPVDNLGRATVRTQQAAGAQVASSVASSAPRAVSSPVASGGSATRSMLSSAADMARNVTKGHMNARNLGIAGAAALLGLGANSLRSRPRQTQSQTGYAPGTYMDESIRKMQQR